MGKIVRFQSSKGPLYGRIEDVEAGVIEAFDQAPWLGGKGTGQTFTLGHVQLLAPCEPSKIVCVGKNYRDHAAEMGGEVPATPVIFIKPSTSVIGPGAAIVRPRASQEVHHEAELAVVIGRQMRRVTAAYARAYGAGMTCLNDVTARDLQRADKQFTRAKSFDTFCPIGPWIDEGPVDARSLGIRCRVNGQVKQNGSTGDMVVEPWELVAFVSRVMTLLPGDVVSTGTPAGVGPLLVGDRVEVEIDRIGTLANTVVDEAGA